MKIFKKIPTNTQIIDFLKSYGLNFIIVFVVLLFSWFTVKSVINTIFITLLPTCELTEMSYKNAIHYKNKTFILKDFYHWEYPYFGDKIEIEFEEKK